MLPISSKVTAGGLTGLLSTAVIAVASAFGVTLPAAAVAAIVTLMILAAAYLKTETKIGKQVASVADEVLASIEKEGPVAGPTDAAFWNGGKG